MNKANYFLCFLCCCAICFHLKAQETSSKKGVDVEDFFRAPQIQQPKTSPDGTYLIYEKFGAIYVATSETEFHSLVKHVSTEYLYDLEWIGDDTFVATKKRKSDGAKSLKAFQIALDADRKKVNILQEQVISQAGYIIDPLLNAPNNFLFAKYRYKDGRSFTDVYNISLFKRQKPVFSVKKRINKNSGKIFRWITDRSHTLYVGVGYEDGVPVLWKKKSKHVDRLHEIWRAEGESRFIPVGLSNDRQTLYVLHNTNSDKVVLSSFDLNSATFIETLYENKKYDVQNVQVDSESRLPIAVTLREKGLLRYVFLNEDFEEKYTDLEKQFPQQQLVLTDLSKNQEQAIVIARSETKAATMSKCNLVTTTCVYIDSLQPWLDNVTFAKTTTFEVTTEDGLSIEAFLTEPNGLDKYPLIVVPHGGPIGVSDGAFSKHAQWLAYNGYGVLKVNYRGSGGYGKAFQNKGLQQWGRGIEDDIEAAIQHVVKNNSRVSESNICGFGSSYGGYSVLMTAVRSEDTYKCLISYAGVTDLTLLFNKGTLKSNDELSTTLKEVAGDPSTQLTEMMEYSPVYNYREINQPVLLLHSFSDKIVDIEHSYRLYVLMQKSKLPVEFKTFRRFEHSFKSTTELRDFYNAIMPFLEKHLKLNP